MIPSAIKVKKSSRCVELTYDSENNASDNSGTETYELSFELLRVMSPSAEVRGHGVGNEVLQHGKKDVNLLRMEPAGNYALKLVFDDGHDSGLYDWQYLHHLAVNQNTLWQEYLQKLAMAGKTRESLQINFKAL